jgi:hypothetical protein
MARNESPVVVGLKFIFELLLVAKQQLALASCNVCLYCAHVGQRP